MEDLEIPVTNHFTELRKRLIYSAGGTMLATIVAFIFYDDIITLLARPANDHELVFVEVAEMIAVSFKVSLIAGLILAFPIILLNVILFIAPALTSREKRTLYVFMPGVALCFGGGVAFGYFILLPPAIGFLLNWGSDLATPMIRISNYINVVVMLLFWIGMVFETPLVMLLLAKLRIVSSGGFARWRKYWVLVAFVLGAIITPTFDPINQSLVAIPLILLYELGIWLSRLVKDAKYAV